MLVLAAGLAGCAGPRARPTVTATCLDAFAAMDQRVARAGVRDADSAPVPGWPWLRVDRVLASFRSETLTPAAREAWLTRLSNLDADGRAVEAAALGAPAVAPLAACRRSLMAETLADARAFQRLQQAARVPDSYRASARVLGLYPLAAPLAARGVARLQARHTPRAGVSPGTSTRVYLPAATSSTPEAAAQALRAAPRDALGFPMPDADTRRALFAAHAPVWLVDSAGADDRIGSLALRPDGAPRVSEPPAVYEHLSYTRFGGAVLLQLNYTVWFPARTATHRLDILAGPLDGLVWRVTLDADGLPLLWDSIHPCGCYHLWFPGPRLMRRAATVTGEPPWLGPALVPTARLALQVGAGNHYLMGVGEVPTGLGGERLAARDYDELRRLPTAAGGVRSLFAPDGLVHASVRAERFLLWPLGVPSAGTMRQRGHQATAFIGRRHFDDADGIARYFERRPADP